jgi:maltose-binding protein MalE
VQLKVAQASSNPPSNLTAARDPALSRMFNDNPILRSLNEQARYDYPTPNLPSWAKVTAIIDESLGRLAKGELRSKDALADIQARVQPLIDQDLKAG